MVTEKKYGIIKRFGTRYGRSLKHRLAEVEVLQKKTYKCPYCGKVKATRIANGIWSCSKCKAKFTGKAYTLESMPSETGEQHG